MVSLPHTLTIILEHYHARTAGIWWAKPGYFCRKRKGLHFSSVQQVVNDTALQQIN